MPLNRCLSWRQTHKSSEYVEIKWTNVNCNHLHTTENKKVEGRDWNDYFVRSTHEKVSEKDEKNMYLYNNQE
jgi:hypothetical protein